MTLADFYSHITAGSVVSIIVIILSLIEITPIKISPLEWIGKRVNHALEEQLGQTNSRLSVLESKLDEHIAQSYRNKILNAQNDLLAGKLFTREEFDEILEACSAYEQYCHDNNLRNDKCNLAIGYIKRTYTQCQNKRSFANLPAGV